MKKITSIPASASTAWFPHSLSYCPLGPFLYSSLLPWNSGSQAKRNCRPSSRLSSSPLLSASQEPVGLLPSQRLPQLRLLS